ncbi:MAG: serine/threonine protein kinase, partial [Bryobacteraceae bacterium]|nr:serine/threonine protein kinase [Bryobacteraceae bacterium]
IDMAYMERGPLSRVGAGPEQAVRWAADVLGALQRCHASGIVHRDVKPSNILLDAENHARLSDFGLAKLLAVEHSLRIRSSVSSCMFVGTPRYAPPEAWDGGAPCPAWDIYSLGMVIYEKLAPEFPFNAISPLGILKQLTSKQVPALVSVNPDVSEKLSDTVAAMISPNPAERPQDGATALVMLLDTPEFARLGITADETIIHRRYRVKSFCRRIAARARREALKFALAFLVSFLVILIPIIVWMATPHLSGPDAGDSIPYPLDLASPQVFDTVEPSGPSVWPAHWLMIPTVPGEAWRVLASAETHIWDMTVGRTDNERIAFSGKWAEYSDPTARLFRYGECRGTGRFVPGQNEIAVALDFIDRWDGSERSRSFLIRPGVTALTAEAFMADMESSDYVPALLYNEIQPRDLAWLTEFEQFWLKRVTNVVTVPYVDSRAEEIRIDGMLSESTWQSTLAQQPEQAGQIVSKGVADGILKIRYSSDALYLAVRGKGLSPDSVIEVGFLTTYDVQTADSPRWMARIRGNKILTSEYTQNQERVAWQCDWQSASTFTTGVFQAEVRIPFGGLPAAIPDAEQRWRLSCDVHEEDDEEMASPVLAWGGANHSDLDRGVLLVFGLQETL